ncbi:phospholipase A1 protein [Dioscorea alata]|uniref:Phospholipase A1 protein n=1 Tax=Dioscorea alata TaxID=55571 RepID=A0ACB7V592_DIOAL|nr:phospholipase A1 protein [Dioscorea alata]
MKSMISPVRITSYNYSPAATLRPLSPSCSQTISTSTSATTNTNLRLGKRWVEYQGTNNWSGLLDPLDDVLRSEILRYGQFIQNAYTSFTEDPSSPMITEMNNSGYRVTQHLYATSGINLPGRSSWIGYIAVCEDEDEISRLGRRDIVVTFRGTVTPFEWLENLRAALTHLPCNSGPMVESGFFSLFTNPGPARRSLQDELRHEIRRLLDLYSSNADSIPISLTFTGHSLGAALAVLSAYDVTETFDDAPMVTVMSFGGPRVGNASFRRRLEEKGSKVLRIVNSQDIITKVPGFVLEEKNSGDVGVPKWLILKTGWVYANIGCELRLDGDRTVNVAACHDLSLYLKLVNQLNSVSCSCPCPFEREPGFWRPFSTT